MSLPDKNDDLNRIEAQDEWDLDIMSDCIELERNLRLWAVDVSNWQRACADVRLCVGVCRKLVNSVHIAILSGGEVAWGEPEKTALEGIPRLEEKIGRTLKMSCADNERLHVVVLSVKSRLQRKQGLDGGGVPPVEINAMAEPEDDGQYMSQLPSDPVQSFESNDDWDIKAMETCARIEGGLRRKEKAIAALQQVATDAQAVIKECDTLVRNIHSQCLCGDASKFGVLNYTEVFDRVELLDKNWRLAYARVSPSTIAYWTNIVNKFNKLMTNVPASEERNDLAATLDTCSVLGGSKVVSALVDEKTTASATREVDEKTIAIEVGEKTAVRPSDSDTTEEVSEISATAEESSDKTGVNTAEGAPVAVRVGDVGESATVKAVASSSSEIGEKTTEKATVEAAEKTTATATVSAPGNEVPVKTTANLEVSITTVSASSVDVAAMTTGKATAPATAGEVSATTTVKSAVSNAAEVEDGKMAAKAAVTGEAVAASKFSVSGVSASGVEVRDKMASREEVCKNTATSSGKGFAKKTAAKTTVVAAVLAPVLEEGDETAGADKTTIKKQEISRKSEDGLAGEEDVVLIEFACDGGAESFDEGVIQGGFDHDEDDDIVDAPDHVIEVQEGLTGTATTASLANEATAHIKNISSSQPASLAKLLKGANVWDADSWDTKKVLSVKEGVAEKQSKSCKSSGKRNLANEAIGVANASGKDQTEALATVHGRMHSVATSSRQAAVPVEEPLYKQETAVAESMVELGTGTVETAGQDVDQVSASFDEANQWYFDGLSEADRKELDEVCAHLRHNPEIGSDDPKVIKHLNMDNDHDNLYFVSYQLANAKQKTVQLVQADRYHTWGAHRSNEVRVDDLGQWYCTVLAPYYRDYNMPIEKARWRYQCNEGTETDFSSKGFYSFDSPDKRGWTLGGDIVDWSDPVCLLKSGDYEEGAFVYGPFDWGDKKIHRISEDVWERALPAILGCGTESGSLFWVGFSEAMLLKAGVMQRLINECRNPVVAFTADQRRVPLFYQLLPTNKQNIVSRYSRQRNLEPNHRYCYSTGDPSSGVFEGAWMDEEPKKDGTQDDTGASVPKRRSAIKKRGHTSPPARVVKKKKRTKKQD